MEGLLANFSRPTQSLQSYDCLESFSLAVRSSGLDVDFQQTQPGKLQIRVQTTPFDKLSITRFCVSAPTIRRGAPKPGVVTFWLREDTRAMDGYWCGQSIDGSGVSVFPGEFYASGHRGLDATVIEIDRKYLSWVAGLMEHDLRDADVRGPLAVQLDRTQLAELVAHKNALLSGCTTVDSAQGQLDLSLGLLNAIRETPHKVRPRLAARQKAFSMACSYIDAYAGEEMTSADLCTAAGVSQRTLEYAFQDCAGLTPKAYLKVVRLNHTRVALRRAEPGVRVADAANRWGFWHMGQFARDYQHLFGRYPKDDLRAAKYH